ncbi:glycoside hydrolase family 3 N-terminal domain-containing protein [Sanguibacter sp. 25GB23B1]|uniref:glycoside hydrolase family 3 N-terminal domain-containing protein n=1 Tax=unclassified Sanguibacter TaxID=2645534 RepID=UPI0032B00BC3
MTRRRWLLVAVMVVLVAVAGTIVVGRSGSGDADRGSGRDGAQTPGPPASGAPTDGSEDPPASPSLAWGPTEADLAQGVADAAALPLERVAGAVIVPRYAGVDATTVTQQITDLGFAGAILFTENVTGPDQVRALTAQLAAAGAADGRTWPVVVGVDQEGGLVQRLRPPFTQLPSFAAAGATGDAAVVREAARARASELRAAGFTMNFAPVADVTIGPDDPTIGSRSAGSEPTTVALVTVAAVEGSLDAGVMPAAKHFPGHGSVTVDSHASLPVQGASVAELEARDLVPFAESVGAGTPMIMMGHVAVTAWQPGVPASLSAPAYAYLRDELGFTGVAVTDSLDMGAVTAGRGPGQVSVEALVAGADLLLTPTDSVAARQAIVDAVASGALSRARLDEAAGRVITMMRWQEKLAGRAEAIAPVSPATIGSAAPAARALSDAAITVLTGQCAGPLVAGNVRVVGGGDLAQEAFAAAAARGGLVLAAPGAPAGAEVRLVTGASGASGGDVVVAVDAPHALATSSAPVKIAAYGRDPGTMDALVAVLQGRQAAPGNLPVAVGPYPVGTGC